MPNMKIIGLVLLVAGAGLGYWGYEMSGSVSSQFSEAFSGSASDDVMIRYIAGAVCAAVGAWLFFKG